MPLTVLSVAYPQAPVGPDAVGGSEQVLSKIDRALVDAGHRSLVVACEGSTTAGELLAVPAPPDLIDGAVIAAAWEPHRRRIAEAIAREPVDVVHLHGFDFHGYLPPPGPPVLATLHLPPDWYPLPALHPRRPDTWLHCVSRSQHLAAPREVRLLAPIPNGVDVEALQKIERPRGDDVVLLGRICPEKGVHHAINAAKAADADLVIAGRVFPYEDHLRYFEHEVRPRLDARRRYVGPAGFEQKRELLAAARCLLAPSLAAETSSLVAMEAIACGTPVIAFPNGALPEVVAHGVTGWIVDDVGAMAAAILAADELDRAAIQQEARRRFCAARMCASYLALYESLAGRERAARASAAGAA